MKDPLEVALRECEANQHTLGHKEANEYIAKGVADRFVKTLESHMDEIEQGYGDEGWPLSGERLSWAAMNDLCHDAGDLGTWARHVRAKRVRAVQHNASTLGRPVPRSGREGS